MSEKSSIEWTDATWNPVRGCTKISPGCKNCYAERFSERFRGIPGHPFEFGFDVRLVPDKLHVPLGWKTPKRIFVNSMSDLFHERVPDGYIEQVAEVMLQAPWHTFQVLTKRAARMTKMLSSDLSSGAKASHLWWGVSVEDRAYGLPRLKLLQQSVANVRFLSIEPLLEDLGTLDLAGISWVIVGGESGPHARPIQPRWVENILAQCIEQNVPFFFKQWGGTRKKRTGRMLNGRTYDAMPLIESESI
jgi:protein gp37